MAKGFVYILINPAMPGWVKVGKTTRDPEERAKELSAATGVPSPFNVAYYATFADCDRAEAYVHSVMESRGVTRSPDREFFASNLRGAIQVLLEAEKSFKSGGVNSPAAQPATGKRHSQEVAANAAEDPVWSDVLNRAMEYRYGFDDTIQDVERAIALYRQAAQMGSAEAYAELADLYAQEEGDVEEGIRFLLKGAESGLLECWLDLAPMYAQQGQNNNSKKAYRRFFRAVDPGSFVRLHTERAEPGDRVLYLGLKVYANIVQAYPDPESDREDIKVMRAFVARFAIWLADLPDESDRTTKLAQLRSIPLPKMPEDAMRPKPLPQSDLKKPSGPLLPNPPQQKYPNLLRSLSRFLSRLGRGS